MTTVTTSTILPAPADTCWRRLKETKTLCYVARPWMTYDFDKSRYPLWQAGMTLNVKPSLHIGRLNLALRDHIFRVVSVDDETKTIVTAEQGGFITTWDHTMEIVSRDDNRCQYTDTIIIEAGALTLFACWYARAFYRHRQQQWQNLLSEQLLAT